MLNFVKKITEDELLKQSILYTFILGLAAHAYCFFNLTISHDSLRAFYIAGKWPKASLGRIFYSAYITLTRGKIVLPWLIGVLALLWISLSVYLLTCMFQVEKRMFVFLIAGVCVTNPSVYATAATYLHDLDANAFAIFLAVAAAYLWDKGIQKSDKKTGFMQLGTGAVILSVCLGIYQSFISVTITLVMIVSVKNLLNGRKYTDVLVNGISGVGMLAGSAALYLLEVKLFSNLTGIDILNNDSYNGLGNISHVFSGDILTKITDTYVSFINAYKNLILTSDPEKLILAVHGILMLGIVVITCIGLKELELGSRILFAVLGILMPFGMNVSSFLSNGMYHVLMQYAVWFLYLLALILVLWLSQEKSAAEVINRGIGILVVLCVCLTIMENIQTANTIYVKKELEYDSTLSYMTRVADCMEEEKGYIPGETPVAFIGEYAIGKSRTGFEKYEVITGIGYDSPITFYDTYKDYFKYVLGRPISLTEADSFENNEIVSEMPVFPNEGSIYMIDDTLVVKLK